jgi:hypothetical protein
MKLVQITAEVTVKEVRDYWYSVPDSWIGIHPMDILLNCEDAGYTPVDEDITSSESEITNCLKVQLVDPKSRTGTQVWPK